MKTVDELMSEAETYRNLLEQAHAWLTDLKVRIDELEEKCDSYAAYVRTQDQEIIRLKQLMAEQKVTSVGARTDVANETETENDQLRQRLSDLNEYLNQTRRDGAQFYL